MNLGNYKQMDLIDPKKVDVGLIKRAIEYGEKNIKRTDNCKHSVIFWGFTGTGKSSTIVVLSGNRLQGYLYGDPILTTPDNIKDVGRVFIEETGISGTAYPAKKQMKTNPNQDQIMLWDSAGLADTKGITQILINTYFIYRIFNIQQQLKMIFTFNAKDLNPGDKGKAFSKTVETLTSVLANFQNYHECMGILITKARNEAPQSQFYSLIEDRINQYKGQKTEPVKKFFRLLLNKQLKVIFIKQPNVSNQYTKQNPKDITNDYNQFRSQFYKLVFQLKSAKSPKLNTLGMMQNSQIEKCKVFAYQILNKLDKEREELYQKLKKFILDKLSKVEFTDEIESKESNKNYLITIKNVIQLKQNIAKYCKQCESEPDKMFDKLKLLFKEHDFQCEQQPSSSGPPSKYCVPMRKYKNDLIIIDFLQTMNIRDMEIGSDLEIKRLFAHLKLKFHQLQSQMQTEKQKLRTNFKQFLVKKFKKHFKKWMQQDISKFWRQNLTIMPSLVIKARDFMTGTTFQTYFQQIRQLEAIGNMKCAADLVEIQDILRFNSSTANLTIYDNQIIRDDIGQIILGLQQEMDDFLNYQKWTQREIKSFISKINYNNKQQKRRTLQEEDALRNRQDNLVQNQNRIKRKEQQLDRKKLKMDKREQQMESQMKKREQKIQKQEQEIKRREHKKEQEMKKREDKIKKDQREIKEREEKKEQEMKKREDKIKKEELEMKKREDKIKKEEQEMKKREDKIKKEEQEMKKREDKIKKNEQNINNQTKQPAINSSQIYPDLKNVASELNQKGYFKGNPQLDHEVAQKKNQLAVGKNTTVCQSHGNQCCPICPTQ